jgi:hypothetical protein
MTLAVNEIAKKPKLISDIEEIVYIKDKRKDILKSIVIPAKYLDMIKDKIEEIEYELWLKKNEKGLMRDVNDLLDGAVEEIGEKL